MIVDRWQSSCELKQGPFKRFFWNHLRKKRKIEEDPQELVGPRCAPTFGFETPLLVGCGPGFQGSVDSMPPAQWGAKDGLLNHSLSYSFSSLSILLLFHITPALDCLCWMSAIINSRYKVVCRYYELFMMAGKVARPSHNSFGSEGLSIHYDGIQVFSPNNNNRK